MNKENSDSPLNGFLLWAADAEKYFKEKDKKYQDLLESHKAILEKIKRLEKTNEKLEIKLRQSANGSKISSYAASFNALNEKYLQEVKSHKNDNDNNGKLISSLKAQIANLTNNKSSKNSNSNSTTQHNIFDLINSKERGNSQASSNTENKQNNNTSADLGSLDFLKNHEGQVENIEENKENIDLDFMNKNSSTQENNYFMSPTQYSSDVESQEEQNNKHVHQKTIFNTERKSRAENSEFKVPFNRRDSFNFQTSDESNSSLPIFPASIDMEMDAKLDHVRESDTENREYSVKTDDSYDFRDVEESQEIELLSSPMKTKKNHTEKPRIEENTEDERKGTPLQDSFIDDSQDDFSEITNCLPTPATDNLKKDTNVLLAKNKDINATSKTHDQKIKKLTKQSDLLLTPDNHYITPSKRRKNNNNHMSETVDLSWNFLKTREWILEDFQPNPFVNNGLDIAYTGTVRGKNRQTEFFKHFNHNKKDQHCKCPQCLKFSEAIGPMPETSGGIRWDNNEKKKKNDDNLMSRFRPNNNDPRIGYYTKHGISRTNIWDRPVSPPGFHRSDFPSTPEIKEYKKKSAMLKKAKMLDRLRDAVLNTSLIDNKIEQIGRFIFKDSTFNDIVKNGCFTIDEKLFLELEALQEQFVKEQREKMKNIKV
ncbi:hypothetical protein PACTADRAFT_4338 [Pachysolen tannophilus NRRL Y-2460]|uniref:DNA endonuclease activator Ctp1 C-terminal domain-containing protein n=1 Tax=Pachysolen tannophilus NRRL Y-2460 TaxID=669874 RepID=A0A1E4TRM2_PACTA|nr:hypothetical protein PACTADRAFT_4338 [Pachysolen tannophilus NRRL Y-2460]